MENFEFEPKQRVELETHLPLISTEEQRFIEDTGGDYSGYIRSNDGRTRYEQFQIARRAHYDEDRRAIVETYIATETIDREGENELRDPKDAVGFSIMLGQLAQSGEDLVRPEIFLIRPIDFKDQRMTTIDLKNLARKVQALAADKASSLSHVELLAAVKDYLRSMGWHDSRQAR
jgi:hypothetical protein